MMTCEEQLELSRNLYDELFAQTEQLRNDRDALCSQVAKKHAEIQRLRDALGQISLEAFDSERQVLRKLALDALDGTPSAAE